MYFNEELRPGIRDYLKKSIWTGLLQGLCGIIFGIYTLISPIGTLSIFLSVIGLLLLLHGGLLVISALMGIRSDSMWLVLFAAGLFQLLLGLFIVSKSDGLSEIAVMLSTVGLGLIGIMTGTISLISAIRYRDAAHNVWSYISRGGLFFIIGVAMLLAPFGFGTAMVRTIAVIAVFLGALQSWGAVKLYIELKS
ncbi:MAG: DUF308 domain-containing protein [Spirochaetales bacterium]|nr:DUF308 domain-containing protein [Spirochaetales bacterium]